MSRPGLCGRAISNGCPYRDLIASSVDRRSGSVYSASASLDMISTIYLSHCTVSFSIIDWVMLPELPDTVML
jgi:hypothetical protein